MKKFMEMKKFLALGLALVMFCGILPGMPQPVSADGVSNSIQFFVATNGNDQNPGTQSLPFKTLEKAKAEIRKLNMTSDVVVYLRGGEYFLDDTFWLGRADSGENGYSVTYQSYPGEQAVINGGSQVTGWQPYSGNIYRAYVGTDKHFTMLSENGEASELARTPNQGYNTLINPNGSSRNDSKTVGYFKAGDVPNISDISNLEMYVWGGGATGDIAWGSDIIGVSSINYGNSSITLKSQASYELGGGSRYYLRGAMEFLDSPGEFYMNESDGYLYYYPKNFPIEDQTIVMPFEKNLIEVRGDNYGKLAGNITFKNLHLVNADYGKNAIYGKFIENVTVKDCIINNIGGDGIHFNEQVESCRIEGCHIYDTGSSGIDIYGSSSGYYSKNNTVTNNMVHDTGKCDGGSGAINLWQTGDSVVSHNTIYDTPRFSICVSSPRDDTPATDYARNITVEYNDMWNANTDSQDTGVFYTWCASGGGNKVRNNNIHDSNIYFSFGYGLYLDDKSDGWEVYNNVIHDLQKDSNGVGHLAGSVMVKGISPVVTNNILANNNNGVIDDGGKLLNETRCDAAFTIQELAPDLRTTDAHITHNIVAFHENPNIYRLQIPTTSVDLGESDYNLYYREYTSTWSYDHYRFDGGNEHNPSDFPTWLTSYGRKYDQNSIIDQNPNFMDMANQDYRIRYDSPAYGIGFNDINMEDMGVTSAFRYGNSSGALRQAYIRAAGDTVNRSWVSLAPGQSENLLVMGRTVDGSVANLSAVSFQSNNPSVASVDGSGKVTAHSEGVARIIATLTSGGVQKSISMDILVGDRAVISSAQAGNTQMDGTLSTTTVSSMSLNFASAMDASSLSKDTVKVFVNEEEITNFTLNASGNTLNVTLPTALSYGETARVVLTTAVKWADGRNIPYEVSRGVTVADLTDSEVAPKDEVYEAPILSDPGITYYSYLDFENETLGQTPGGGGNEISGLQFYNWRDTNIVTDPAGGDNQVLRIFKPVSAGDMSIDNMKMFENNAHTPVTTFETKIYIDELFTEWMIQAVSGGWAKANILYFGYQELETDVHDAVKRPVPDIGYIRAYNGSTEVKHTGTPIFENTWYTLTMTFDMVNGKYSVYIDGKPLFTDYTLPLSGDFRGVRIYNNLSGYRNDSTIYLDDYCVYEGTAKFGTPTGEVATQAPTPVPTATPKPTAVPTPAPVTEVPVTPVPVTPAPVTPAPVTPAPVTPVPVTPAPVTPAPVTPVPVTPAPITDAPTQVPDCYLYQVDTSSIGNNFDHNLGWQNMQDRIVGSSINHNTPNSTFVLDPDTDINTALKIHKSGSTYIAVGMPFCANSDWNTPNWSTDDFRKGNTGACYEFKIKATTWDTQWTFRTNNSYNCFTLTGDGVHTNSDNRLNAYSFEANKWYRIVFFMTGWNSFNLYIDAEGTENDVMFESLSGNNNENRIHGSDVYAYAFVNSDSSNTDAAIYIDDVCMYKNGWDSAVSAFMTRENSCPYIGSGSVAEPTDVPVTEVPVTEVPVTEVPVTEAPVTEVPVTDAPVTDGPDTEVELVTVDTSVLGGEFDSNVGFQNMQNRTVGSSINGSETFATFQLDPATDVNTVYAISKTSSGSISASMPFSADGDWNVPNWSNDSYRKGNTGACYEFKVKADSWDTSWTLRTNWSYNCFTLTGDGVYTNSDNRLTPYNFEANKWYRIVFVMTGWNSFNLYIDAEGSENDVLITGLGGQNNENRIHASDIYSMRMENTDGNATNATLYIDDVCIYKNCWSDTVLSFIQRNNSAPISGIQAQ